MRTFLLLPALLLVALSQAQEKPVVSGGGKSSPLKQTQPPTLLAQVMSLMPNHPTDKTRAILIAKAYFHFHIGDCGGGSAPIDKGSYWLINTAVGIGGESGPDILVDKRTGASSAKGLPTVKDPSAYYRKLSATKYWLVQRARS